VGAREKVVGGSQFLVEEVSAGTDMKRETKRAIVLLSVVDHKNEIDIRNGYALKTRAWPFFVGRSIPWK
jgi:hypothetical protein